MKNNDVKCFFKVASAGDTVYIKVFGYATAVCCPTLRTFVEKMCEEKKSSFIIDLKSCKMMDSSFMGTLISMIEPEGDVSKKLIIINAGERNYSLLQSVGLTRVLTILKDDIDVPKNLSLHKLEVQQASKEQLLRVVEQAHDKLIKLDESNRKRFEPLLKMLKKEFIE